MKKFLTTVVTLLALCITSFAQWQSESTVRWKTSVNAIDGEIREIVWTGRIAQEFHIYGLDGSFNPTTVSIAQSPDYEVVEGPYALKATKKFEEDEVWFDTAKFGVKVRVKSASAVKVTGELSWQACKNDACMTPEYEEFSVELPGAAAGAPASAAGDEGEAVSKTAGPGPSTVASDNAGSGSGNNVVGEDSQISSHTDAIASESNTQDSVKSTEIADPEAGGSSSNWALILEAILWGFAMLLTPCVFPMVPMTISFFMKGSSSPAAGRFKAFMYGVFIVLLYTLPITIIILITRLLGGDSVTADIFNWLATHWLPNIIFFIVFMVFAASFFGAFEIVLPSSIVNKSDQNSDKKGLAGIFFMALTLVLVSFSCTGPIVGTVLIKATQGQSFWTPVLTMLAFSVAFALPFTILALFPSLLKKMKGKSGSWLGSVKVVLGFIEVALGFKFLSVADQTYHWGLLDREVYLAIWIVVFTLLGLYLLGKIRFKGEEPAENLSVLRLVLVIVDFSFVVYLIPGMWGAPLKALSGYLPPLETQDFVVWNRESGDAAASKAIELPEAQTVAHDLSGVPDFGTKHLAGPNGAVSKLDLKLPLGLTGYFTLEDGLAAAKAAGKPLFVDITGHGCVNCREMESRVWSDPRVLSILRENYIITALYTDDKSKLEEKDWVTTENGKVLKDFGRVNSYIVRKHFNVNAQPNYALLSPDGNLLVPIRGYNLDVEKFIAFLQSGLDN